MGDMGRASLTASITCWRSDKFTRDHLVFCKELAALQRRRQGLKDEVAMCDMEIERLEKLVKESRGKENTAVLAPSESEGAPLPAPSESEGAPVAAPSESESAPVVKKPRVL